MTTKLTSTPVQLKERFDETFEEKVLQLSLRDKAFAIKYFNILKPSYFSSIYHRALFTGFYEYFLKYKKLPGKYEMEVYVVKEYNGNDKMIAALNEVLKTIYTEDLPNADYFDDLLIEFVKRAEFSVLLWDAIQNFDDVNIDFFHSKVSTISNLKNQSADLGVSSDDFDTRLASKDEETMGLPSTFRNFNAVVRGGLRPGELAVFMAPTNRGKTHTLVNFGRSLHTMGHTVVHYSLEMSEDDVMDRYIASMTQTQLADLASPTYFKELVGLLHNYRVFTDKKLHIKFYPAHTVSVKDIAAHLNLLIEAGTKPDVVIIDYIDLLKATKDRKEKRFELGDLYVEVRALGHAFNVPIITASQTNRQGELNDWNWKEKKYESKSRALNIAHISEDFSKAFTADYIFGIRKSMKHPIAGNNHLLIMDTLKSRHSARDTRLGFSMNWGACYMEDVNIDGYNDDEVE